VAFAATAALANQGCWDDRLHPGTFRRVLAPLSAELRQTQSRLRSSLFLIVFAFSWWFFAIFSTSS
jgi:hypothetical protein